MYRWGLASSRHGWMRMPSTPVMIPPVRKLISLGKALDGAGELAGQRDRVPDRLAVDHHGRRGDEHRQQREEGHGGGQPQDLADGLLPLAAAEPRGPRGSSWSRRR